MGSDVEVSYALLSGRWLAEHAACEQRRRPFAIERRGRLLTAEGREARQSTCRKGRREGKKEGKENIGRKEPKALLEGRTEGGTADNAGKDKRTERKEKRKEHKKA